MLSNSERVSKPQTKVLFDLDDIFGDASDTVERPVPPKLVKSASSILDELDDLGDLLGTAPPKKSTDEELFAELDALPKRSLETRAADGTTAATTGKFSFPTYTTHLDMKAVFPKSHSFVFGEGKDGMLPMAALTVMGAPGGMLKTTTAISWAAHVASGQSWNGFKTRAGIALVVSMEDDPDETMRKGVGITLSQIPDHLHDLVQRRLSFAMLYGVDARLTANAFGYDQRTVVPGQIVSYCKQLESTRGQPVVLIVFDHARLAIGGDVNASGAVTELTKALNHIAKETGAAVLLLCHSPKSTVNPNHSGIYTNADVLGSGAFVDNARQGIVLTPLTEDERKRYGRSPEDAKPYVAMRIIKSNYSETDRVYHLRKTPMEGWGIVVPDAVTLSKPAREVIAPPKNEDTVLDYIRANEGRFTKSSLKLHSGSDGPLGMGEKALQIALGNLLGSARVRTRAPTAEEVEAHGLSKQAKQVLYAAAPPKG